MKKTKKVSDLERYLQGHKPLCRIHVYSDDERRCTCGLEGALKELEELKAKANNGNGNCE